jgi:small subunit ribosomal protein S17
MNRKNMQLNINNKSTFIGHVIKQQFKTLIVDVRKKIKHKKYGKFLNVSRKYMVHDANNKCCVGDAVFIAQSKPYSHKKRWIVIGVKTINN